MPRITRLAGLFHAALHRVRKITIELAELDPEDDGRCNFATGTIRLSLHLSPRALFCALVHEIVHLVRGPVRVEDADAEEVIVEQIAAEVLIPRAAALASIDHRWTNAEVATLAVANGVDTQLMHQVLDPPTMPIPIPVPRDATSTTTRDMAARKTRRPRPG